MKETVRSRTGARCSRMGAGTNLEKLNIRRRCKDDKYLKRGN